MTKRTNKYLLLIAVFVLTALAFACKSTPKPIADAEILKESTEIETQKLFTDGKIIEHKNSATGDEIPDWVYSGYYELEELTDYEGSYVFKFHQTGKELEELNRGSRSFEADTEIARRISERAIGKFQSAELAGKDEMEIIMEGIAKIIEVAEYSGTRKVSDFWIYSQIIRNDGKDDEKVYTYLLLFSVPKDQIHNAIDRAIRNEELMNQPETEEEQAAFDRVKVLFMDGLY